jgi:Cdc6-like AAA superfamily ATPase
MKTMTFEPYTVPQLLEIVQGRLECSKAEPCTKSSDGSYSNLHGSGIKGKREGVKSDPHTVMTSTNRGTFDAKALELIVRKVASDRGDCRYGVFYVI